MRVKMAQNQQFTKMDQGHMDSENGWIQATG